MALVERMSVLGIRSFGHESPQKIEFFTPVTLILGPNGTGKTVSAGIIFSLNVAFTKIVLYKYYSIVCAKCSDHQRLF